MLAGVVLALLLPSAVVYLAAICKALTPLALTSESGVSSLKEWGRVKRVCGVLAGVRGVRD